MTKKISIACLVASSQAKAFFVKSFSDEDTD